MGFCIMLYTVHTTQGQRQGQVTIVFYCTRPGPDPCPVPCPVQCEWAIRRIVSPREMKWTLGTALHSLRKFYCRTLWVQAHKYPGGAQTIYNVAVVLTELCDFEAFFKVTDKIYLRTTSLQKQVCAFSAFLIRFFSTTAIQVFFFFTYFFLHVWFNDLNECSPDKQHVWCVNCRVVGLG